jgi:hypothetical protein
VAKRGDVLVARRKLGFGADGRTERFVILQSDSLRDLDTLIVAPLDADAPMYAADPLVVRVSPREAGAKSPHVVLVHLTGAFLRDRFQESTVGRLTAVSLARVDALLSFILR